MVIRSSLPSLFEPETSVMIIWRGFGFSFVFEPEPTAVIVRLSFLFEAEAASVIVGRCLCFSPKNY